MSYTKILGETPQNEPIPGKKMAENNAGGFVFEITPWSRLERFLIIGSDEPTYYQSARELTKENYSVVNECWKENPGRTAVIIREISLDGRAQKQDAILFALALGVSHETDQARACAYNIVCDVCRTASHLFRFLSYAEDLGKGWGRGMKRVINKWYDKPIDKLAYQMIKYRERYGFTHKRMIEAGRINTKGAPEDRFALFRWTRSRDYKKEDLPRLVKAMYAMRETGSVREKRKIITDNKLPWEAIPTEDLRKPEIMEAMLPHMGLTALVRQLGRLTEIGLFAPNSDSLKLVVSRLTDQEALRAARVHPFSLLLALGVYKSGHGDRGGKSWTPASRLIDALDSAFYLAFANVEPTGKRFILALDVSGSMGARVMGSALTCREAAAAMALITAATEAESHFLAFAGPRSVQPLDISPKMRLDDVVRAMTGLRFGSTDCAAPMIYASENKIPADCFCVYTDSETWAGRIHPCKALVNYRREMKIPAKLAVIGMVSTGFSIADPQDGGMMDFVGFDSAAPAILADFARG